MDKKIENKIRALKNIYPDAGFARLSRDAILSSPQVSEIMILNESAPRMSFLYSLVFSLSATTAIVLMVILMGGINGPRAALAVRDLSEIETEAPILSGQMDDLINNTKNFDQSHAAVSVALIKASEEIIGPTDKSSPFPDTPTEENNIDDLLNEATL